MTVFSAMLSAFGEMLSPLGLPQRIGALIIALICIPILSSRADNILNLSGIIGVILCGAIITATLYMLRYREYHTFSGAIPVINSGAVYAGYNLVSVMPVLIVISRRLKSRAAAAA